MEKKQENVVPNKAENEDKKPEKQDNNVMPQYIYAFDPTIKKRVVHVVKDGYAISMVTGHRFRYEP